MIISTISLCYLYRFTHTPAQHYFLCQLVFVSLKGNIRGVGTACPSSELCSSTSYMKVSTNVYQFNDFNLTYIINLLPDMRCVV